MSNLHSNAGVIPMPAMSTAAIVDYCNNLLSLYAPQLLAQPTMLNVPVFMDWLGQFKIHTYPACDEELNGNEGLTFPADDGTTTILLSEEQYEALDFPDRRAHRARCTALHEGGHALLHIPVIRNRKVYAPQHAFARVSSQQLKPYHDPEWQAFTFAGCTAMPVPALRMLAPSQRNPWDLSTIFGVSPDLAGQHLRRVSRML